MFLNFIQNESYAIFEGAEAEWFIVSEETKKSG